jgi:hypothetical protein
MADGLRYTGDRRHNRLSSNRLEVVAGVTWLKMQANRALIADLFSSSYFPEGQVANRLRSSHQGLRKSSVAREILGLSG